MAQNFLEGFLTGVIVAALLGLTQGFGIEKRIERQILTRMIMETQPAAVCDRITVLDGHGATLETWWVAEEAGAEPPVILTKQRNVEGQGWLEWETLKSWINRGAARVERTPDPRCSIRKGGDHG